MINIAYFSEVKDVNWLPFLTQMYDRMSVPEALQRNLSCVLACLVIVLGSFLRIMGGPFVEEKKEII